MEFHAWYICALILTGSVAGFSSGLLGVGGGFLMVPVQFWGLKAIGVAPDIAFRMALGTNLLVVIPTALTGALMHHKRGAVIWKAAYTLGATGVLGAYAGAILATHLPVEIMTFVFGAVVVAMAVRMVKASPLKPGSEPVTNMRAYLLWGLPFGVVTGVLGVAGGGIMVPVMVYLLNFSIHQALATSTAMMVFTASGGALSFLVHGVGVEGLPPHSIGYINWFQWLLLAGLSMPMAALGARTAHLMPARHIRRLFMLVLFYIGFKMLGLFGWLGLPV